MLSLRPYQQESVDAVYSYLRDHNDNPCVVLPTAAGKSICIGKIASDAVKLWNGRVLILAHVKELLEQNAGKVRSLCPEIPVGIYSAGLDCRDTSEPILVAGIQSVYNKADVLGKFDLIIVDECFPAGTMIDTPRGKIPIEDLYVGQPIYHAFGVGNIEAISSRPTRKLIELELSNGKKIKCTENHPFFSESGWIEAGSLAVGTRLYSREDVSCLRKGVSSEDSICRNRETSQMRTGMVMETPQVLQPGMSGNGFQRDEMECRYRTAGNCMEDIGKNCDKILSMLRKGNSTEILSWCTDRKKSLGTDKILLNILLQESGESNVQTGSRSEGFKNTSGDWSQTENSWRKRDISDTPAGEDCEYNWINGRDRILCCNDQKAEERWSVKLLQTGCCDSISSFGNTVGREYTFNNECEEIRQEHESMDGGIRVVNITHIQLESPCVVYNLQIEGHPSYYADGVLVHNCHLIQPEGEGMYRTFLHDMKTINPLLRVIGFTATPYRLKGGLICKPENILNAVCYEAGIKEMIAQGYLSPIVTRAGRAEAHFDDLHIRAGEFIQSEIEEAMDRDEITDSACREIVDLTRDRNSVLIFCTSIEHCNHVAEKITAYSGGKECAIVTGDTPAQDRQEILERFKGKRVAADLFGNLKPPLKYLCNMNVLTTGFDAPNTDCIVLLRPTASPGLLVQMVGRGFRLSPDTGKTNCIVLDYGDNIMRHGPIDCITVHDKTPGHGDAPAKKCPECLALIHAGYAVCPECGYKFPPGQGSPMSRSASGEAILSGQVTYTDLPVHSVHYSVHRKRGADDSIPSTMRIDYDIGFHQFVSEWVCPEHSGYAREKFVKWWKKRAAEGCQIPDTAAMAVALANEGLLSDVSEIRLKKISGEKFEHVVSCTFKERPVMREPGEDEEPDWRSNSPADLGVSQDFDDSEIPF